MKQHVFPSEQPSRWIVEGMVYIFIHRRARKGFNGTIHVPNKTRLVV